MKKLLIIGLAAILFFTGCVKPEDITTEAKCTEAKFYWCDDTGDGTFNCQKDACAVCDSSHLVLCVDETTCTGAGLNWCDDDGDGTFECQAADCTFGSLTGEVPETEVGLGTNETDLGEAETSAEGMGLGDIGDIGSTLSPLEGVDTTVTG